MSESHFFKVVDILQPLNTESSTDTATTCAETATTISTCAVPSAGLDMANMRGIGLDGAATTCL